MCFYMNMSWKDTILFPRRVSPVTCTWRCVQSQTRAPCRSLPSPSSPCPSATSECSRSVLPRAANRDGWGENLISRHEPGSRWVRKGMLEQNFYHFSFFLFGFAGRWRRNGQLPGKDTAVPLASYTMTLNHRISFLFFHSQRQPSTKKNTAKQGFI